MSAHQPQPDIPALVAACREAAMHCADYRHTLDNAADALKKQAKEIERLRAVLEATHLLLRRGEFVNAMNYVAEASRKSHD